MKILGWIVGVLFLLVLAVGTWMYFRANAYYDQRWSPHVVSFAVPFPLSTDELTALRQERLAAGAPKADPLADMDLQKLALDHAMARGRHLIETRLGCSGCHGDDFGGRTIIDSPMVGYWAAPNITKGDGGVVKDFGVKEWDYAVRHGIRHDLRTSSMPSEEFRTLSDHELSDVIAFIRSRPPVNRRVDSVRIGPLFAFALVTDLKGSLSAFTIDHQAAHDVEPPATAPTAELGQHIAQVCTSCHGPTFSGGAMQGDPNMPVVANITPHDTGLKGWTEQDFFTALRKGRRKDGSEISTTMPWQTYGQMSDTELKALWIYLQTVPPREKGNH